MRKITIIFLFIFATNFIANGQSKGIRIGYIDMEYILQNVPDYIEAKNQLEQKAQKWKQEAEVKKNDIVKLKESLNTEKVLLTKELIEEREEEIKIKEAELSDYQQKRFGATGDLIMQKTLLVQPIQDQVFTAVQDIAESRKYDFIFDKSSDLTMLFAAKRFNVSDQVIKVLTRANKRDQLTKKQLKEQQAKELKEDAEDINPELAERRKALEEKKANREKAIADKKQALEQKKLDIEEKKQKAKSEKDSKKGAPDSITNSEKKEEKKNEKQEQIKTALEEKQIEKAKIIEDRKKEFEARKKAIEEKKQKVISDREAAKKEKEEKAKALKEAKEKNNK